MDSVRGIPGDTEAHACLFIARYKRPQIARSLTVPLLERGDIQGFAIGRREMIVAAEHLSASGNIHLHQDGRRSTAALLVVPAIAAFSGATGMGLRFQARRVFRSPPAVPELYCSVCCYAHRYQFRLWLRDTIERMRFATGTRNPASSPKAVIVDPQDVIEISSPSSEFWACTARNAIGETHRAPVASGHKIDGAIEV